MTLLSNLSENIIGWESFMKKLAGCVVAMVAFCSFADDIQGIVAENLKKCLCDFPVVDSETFSELQSCAAGGDSEAQDKLFPLLSGHVEEVYSGINEQGSLLFSVRRAKKGFYDEASNNYAANIEMLFEETTDDVHIKKQNFSVETLDGSEYQISYPRYKCATESIEVLKDSQRTQVKLADLTEPDYRFVESALMDAQFKSRSDFVIEVDDSRLGEVGHDEDRLHNARFSNGERVSGVLERSSMEGIRRCIILENRGALPVENLIVEYQSFAEQQIIEYPKDFPTDYCCAGYRIVKSIQPDERLELPLDLPTVVQARTESFEDGDYIYYRNIPSDCNQRSKGRMNGLWVKVHRITPYGERLEREYKTSGVSSKKWAQVIPVSVDIR